jgi:DNA-binding response OmpR family regulator
MQEIASSRHAVHALHAAESQTGCQLVFIDGVPYLRLGEVCGLWQRVLTSEGHPGDGIRLTASKNRMACGDREIDLTRVEFRLVSLLLDAYGACCSFEYLIETIWGQKDTTTGRVSIRSHVCAIRSKLRAAGLPDQLIINVRGKGLRLDPRAI